jgi:hypothetical protein
VIAAVIVALVAPKNMMLFVVVVLKLVPVKVTNVPTTPLIGEKLVKVGIWACANPSLSKVKTAEVNHNDICLLIVYFRFGIFSVCQIDDILK